MFQLQATETAGAYTMILAPDGLAPDGLEAESYRCDMSVCPSPTCGCEVLTFACAPDNAAARQRLEGAEQAAFRLDLVEREVADNEPSPGLHLGGAVVAALDEAGWESLGERMMAAKAELIDGLDPEQLEAEFPFQEIEDDSLLVGWHDVFPLASRFEVGEGATKLPVDDAYCVAPGCACNRAAIELFPAADGDEPAAFGFDIDFRHRSWTDAETGRKPKGRAATQAARLRQAHPEIEKEWARRRGVLRQVYARNRGPWMAANGRVDDPSATAVQEEPPMATPKVGRNAPCPCGSGKKYKRCCA